MSTELSRPRAWIAAYWSGAAAVALGSAVLFAKGHWIFGLLGAFMALGLAFSAREVREADCPACGAPIGSFLGTIVPCGSCRRYAVVEQDRLVPAKSGLVTEKPFFTTKVESLLRVQPDPAQWRFPASACCVCAKPATRSEPVKVRFEKSRFLNMVTLEVYTFEVPHCAEHEQGMIFDYDEFKFRSWDYWRTFEEANRL